MRSGDHVELRLLSRSMIWTKQKQWTGQRFRLINLNHAASVYTGSLSIGLLMSDLAFLSLTRRVN